MPIYRDNLQNAALDRQFLRQPGALDYLKLWLNDSLCGLTYLHSNKACHLDIKADNILISQDNRAVICDFSCLACATKTIPRDDLGLPLMYRPPEAFPSFGSGTEVDGKAFDMWAFGIMVLELFTSKSLSRAISCAGNWNRDIYPILFNILQV
ncbi:mitogen-activated protein kinase 4-like [Parasteatoda tepidariorum]|uniref:mitogen-activated protein kinase 4-like n=1 Tax=Parasteatoda tepidariorum TaxID=114398 RepID=UPI0039BCEA1A